MAFDTSELDAACLSDDFSDDAIWLSGPSKPKKIQVIFSAEGTYENEDGVRVQVDGGITAGTLESSIVGMKRKDLLEIKGRKYMVVGFDPDGSGWTEILLEKAR